MMKASRQNEIIELISSRDIETQEELAAALRERGFQVTQATVSRDIRDMRLTKVAAKSGGIVGGAVSGSFSVISNTIALANGEIDAGEALGCIVNDTAGGALSGAGSAAAATVTGAAVASAVAGTAVAGTAIGTACVVAAPVVVALGVGCAISAIWSAIWD